MDLSKGDLVITPSNPEIIGGQKEAFLGRIGYVSGFSNLSGSPRVMPLVADKDLLNDSNIFAEEELTRVPGGADRRELAIRTIRGAFDL